MARKRNNNSKTETTKGRPFKNTASRVKPAPTNGERSRTVSEAAYFRALNRNFEGGDPVTDWLEAEKQIMNELSEP
jgi:hypothetical protein